MFDKALVPFDGSTQVDRILPYVARFAGGLHMPLVLASVLAPGPTSTLEQRRWVGQCRRLYVWSSRGGAT